MNMWLLRLHVNNQEFIGNIIYILEERVSQNNHKLNINHIEDGNLNSAMVYNHIELHSTLLPAVEVKTFMYLLPKAAKT